MVPGEFRNSAVF